MQTGPILGVTDVAFRDHQAIAQPIGDHCDCSRKIRTKQRVVSRTDRIGRTPIDGPDVPIAVRRTIAGRRGQGAAQGAVIYV